ncbi:hypothetical protein S7335_4041 [Synechococcus sp. PCC 7335]|uniref:DUF4168 domain-containing protein n=1 Tax=Synechococcus sp. (strain ATCC 29403 / PCC 7335) TaxID=91464 RepID=UPI00017ECEE5|nr:DUF4168 domain-containing protein [Synechococcus sp. PCC 7335]EDX86338.1 hypothetical protein S7335_4041 [Synechococcus sp. PCC 7335]
MSVFFSLNRIFFYPSDIRGKDSYRFTQAISTSLKAPLLSLLNLFVVLLLVGSVVLTFPSSSLSAPLVTIGAAAQPSADKLDQFARAYVQILQLLSDRQSELPEDETSPTALAVQQSIETDTIEIIQASGLKLSEYMEILNAASQDETLQHEIFGISAE